MTPKYGWLGLMSLLCAYMTYAQDNDSSRLEHLKIKIPNTELKVTQSVQIWNVVSMLNEAEPDAGRRNDIFIRRGRLGLQGTCFNKIDFNLAIAYDGIGKDKIIEAFGNPNDPDNRIFMVWDAFFTYKVHSLFNTTFGYFRPQFGRENITSAFFVIGFEKGLTNSLVRNQMLHRASGREAGINFGGLYLGKSWSINYNLGLFNPTAKELNGKGEHWYPLMVGRVALTVGDPELDEYAIRYVQSYYGKRKGVTLAYNHAYQGKTDVFMDNEMQGVDLLFNFGPVDIVAEYDWMRRDTMNVSERVSERNEAISLKAGYNLVMFKTKVLQPIYSYTENYTGSYRHFHDVGVNFLFYEDDLKAGLHYVWGRGKGDRYEYISMGIQLIF